MADSEIQRKSLREEIDKAGKALTGHQTALTLLQQADAGDDVTVAYLSETIANLRDTKCKLETQLQLLESRQSQDACAPSERQLEKMAVDTKKPIVYVIHAHNDLAFVQPIMDYLKTLGIQVVHPSKDYDAGKSNMDNIEKWITKADRVVAVLSPNALESNWVDKELLQTRQEQTGRHKQMLIPILYEIGSEQIPHYYQDRHYVDAQNPTFRDNTDALCRQVAKEVFADDIPYIGTMRLGDIATGQAWSYFYGYLNLIIPTFEKRLKESQYWKEEKGNMSTRFVVLCPDSCYCHPSLGDSDSRIKAMASYAKEKGSDEGFIKPVSESRGGTPKRAYRQGVYRITMGDGQRYYVVGEYATPILTMFEMEEQGWAGLKGAERLYQKKKFVSLLRDILYQARMEKSVLLLSYDDTAAEGFKYPVADDLVRAIREEAAARPAHQDMDTN